MKKKGLILIVGNLDKNSISYRLLKSINNYHIDMVGNIYELANYLNDGIYSKKGFDCVDMIVFIEKRLSDDELGSLISFHNNDQDLIIMQVELTEVTTTYQDLDDDDPLNQDIFLN